MVKRMRVEVSQFSVEKFLSHCTKIFHWRTLWCFREIFLTKIFIHRRGPSRFCRKFFYLTAPKKLRQGTILCFRKFLVGKKFLWIRGWGAITFFRRKVFVSLYQNISLEKTLVFQKNFLSKIFIHRRGPSRFCRNFFVSQDRNEKLCKGTLLFSRKFLISKNFLDKRGHVTIFS